MNRACILVGCSWVALTAGAMAADDKLPGDGKPLLQLQTDGPTAKVTALAFGVLGDKPEQTVVLYAGGYDKVVRTLVREASGRFVPGKRVYRLPIRPGTQGAINALAVSPDGRWLAAAGSGLMREAAGFFDTGIVEPRAGRLSEAMLQDEGTIYLFDTGGKKVRLLRGHRGPVLALAFAPARRGKHPLLVSAAREPSDRAQGHGCVVRLWDAEAAALLASSPELPDPADGRPGLGIWHTGDEVGQLRVAVACHGQPLRVWDASAKAAVKALGEPLNFNEPIAFAADDAGAAEGTLFTTGTPRRWRACLYAWKVSGDRSPQVDNDREVLLPERSLSYALTLLAARPGGRIERAALVQCLREDNDPRHHEYRLLLLSVGRGAAYGRLRAYAPLWTGGPRPALAASADGAYLAVAGGPSHEIRLYRADNLSREKPEVRQTFRSRGVAFRSVAFVRKAETSPAHGTFESDPPPGVRRGRPASGIGGRGSDRLRLEPGRPGGDARSARPIARPGSPSGGRRTAYRGNQSSAVERGQPRGAGIGEGGRSRRRADCRGEVEGFAHTARLLRSDLEVEAGRSVAKPGGRAGRGPHRRAGRDADGGPGHRRSQAAVLTLCHARTGTSLGRLSSGLICLFQP
jgi:hypothetical protein